MHALPEATARLLREIDRLPESQGLVLVGGTALSLRIAHRASEDLDFFFTSNTLPRTQINTLLDQLRLHHQVKNLADLATQQDFINAGRELEDQQQDYQVDKVKITFFIGDSAALNNDVASDTTIEGLINIRVATLDTLFLLKSAILNRRIMTRDLFDIFTLVRNHGYQFKDVMTAADKYGYSQDALKMRLVAAKKRTDDPGLETLVNGMPDFDELKIYFLEQIDRLEQDQATKALQASQSKSPPS